MVELNLYATPNKLDTTSINKSEVMSKCLQKRNFPIKQLPIIFFSKCVFQEDHWSTPLSDVPGR